MSDSSNETGAPDTVVWYKSAVIRGLLTVFVTQAIARLHLGAYLTNSEEVVNAIMDLISTAALAYAAHGRISKPNPPVTLIRRTAIVTDTTPPNLGQQLLEFLKLDVVTSLGQPLVAFLQAVQAKPDPLNVAAQYTLLTAAVLAQAPAMESTLIAQVAGALQARVQALLTKAQAGG